MKTIGIALLTLALGACVGAPRRAETPKQETTAARCQENPTWLLKDEQGRDLAVYICFGDQNRLLYTVRIVPPAAATKPQPKPRKASARASRARPGPTAPASAAAPPAAPPPVPLATLGGTAQ